MQTVMFYHSLVSDWNHDNAHFLRGIVTELISRGHQVRVYEPENGWSLGHLGTCHHNAFNCSARAVLNISRDSMADNGFSPATRVFEAAGAGACIITDKWEGIDYFFEPEKEIYVAASRDEVASILNQLTPELSSLAGKRALTRARTEHTYAHRARQFEGFFGL